MVQPCVYCMGQLEKRGLRWHLLSFWCFTYTPFCPFAGQSSCSFGDGVLCLADATLASETCEELFTPQVRRQSLNQLPCFFSRINQENLLGTPNPPAVVSKLAWPSTISKPNKGPDMATSA